MNNRTDIGSLKQTTDIVNVIERHVALKKRGSEYYGICPFHNDTTTSLQVNQAKQIFKCFACNAGGDSIDFLTKLGHSFKEALLEVGGESISGSGQVQRSEVAPRAKPITWTQIDPPNEEVKSFNHYRHGEPSKVWPYHRADGRLLGFICRFDLADGAKEVIPYIYATDGNRSEWRWQGFDKPRPLYNLHLIAANPAKSILVVEGEKTADAAQALFPNAIVTAWQGGARAIHNTDWKPLEGRTVVLWPDNDDPGNIAMWDINDILQPMGCANKWVTNPTDAPKHWDLADSNWTSEQARAYAHKNMSAVPSRLEAAPEPTPEPEPQPEPPTIDDAVEWVPPADLPDDDDHRDYSDLSFRFLGFTKDGENIKHHFFSNAAQTVLSFNPSGMTINNLMQLAPLNYWENNFQGSKGLSVTAAVNWLVNTSVSHGHFSEKYIRGRGAWVTDGKHIIHSGEHLIVDGQEMRLDAHGGKYVYESGEPMPFSTKNPLPTAEANRLMEISNLLNWEREISAHLLVGWCIIAPMCGALKWRPHIWLTGAAGTGKSWVFRNIVRRLMEGIALEVQGETSEAGLRQQLGHDALPVVFDEAEGEDRKAQERMQSVLGLMRVASSEDGGLITKGSAGGSAVSYKIRSCFAFASISVQVSQQSDRSRVTILGLRKLDSEEGAERWKDLQAKYHEIITDDFVSRLQARTIMLMPVILANARTFSAAAAVVIGEQRAGDQLGALLAGAYSIHSNKEITLEDAITWLKARDWSEEKSLDKTRDEVSLLAHIMEQMTFVETTGSRYERNVGELVAIAAHEPTGEGILPYEAQQRLKRVGIKVEDQYLVISNTADWVKKCLANTPWSKNHNKILLRLEGAIGLETTRFGSGIQTRAVGIPLRLIFEGQKPPTPVVMSTPWD